MRNKHVRDMVLAAMFLALGWLLPFLTGNIPEIGGMLLPMHLPVLICGIILGPRYGFLIGLILPITRSFMFGMPPFPIAAVPMTFELAAYGGIIGIMYSKLPKTIPSIYISLIVAMLAGRIVWAAARVAMLGLMDTPFSFQIFLTSAFISSWPGIVLQIVLIPVLIVAIKKAGWERSAQYS